MALDRFVLPARLGVVLAKFVHLVRVSVPVIYVLLVKVVLLDKLWGLCDCNWTALCY